MPMDRDSGEGFTEEQVKQDFGRRLYKLMLNKGWRQSELARKAGMQRSSISAYIRGNTLPTPVNIDKLAAALGVSDPDDLLPKHLVGSTLSDRPVFELRAGSTGQGRVHVRLDMVMPMDIASEITALVKRAQDDADKRVVNGG